MIENGQNPATKSGRKTLDEILGAKGFLISALVGSPFGSLVGFFSVIFGLAGIFYTIKERNNPKITKREQYTRWALVILWLLAYGITAPYKK